jgi:AraC-like DNA-binding protein
VATATEAQTCRPLAGYQVASTSRPDEATDIISDTYCGHEVRILDPISSLKFDFCEARLGRTTVGAMSFDADIRYDLGETENYFLIQLADTGSIEYVNGGETCEVTPDRGMVTSPTRPLLIHYGEASRGLILKIQKSALERHMCALTGVPIGKPLIFQAGMEPGSHFTDRYKRLLHYLLAEIDADENLLDAPLWVADLEDLMMTALLTGQPHNYSARFDSDAPAAGLTQVESIEAFIQAAPARPFRIEDFVALTGVSGRSLHRAFQKHRGYTPMAFVRATRLALARARLVGAHPGTTVTQIAQDCGFDHLGRFSQDYAQCFAEAPSETLRRSRRKRTC